MGTSRWLGIPRPLSGLAHPREAVRNFTPSWFTVVMSCGIVSYLIGGIRVASLCCRRLKNGPGRYTAAATAASSPPSCRRLAAKFPYHIPGQLEVGWAFWWITVVLFCTFSIMLASR